MKDGTRKMRKLSVGLMCGIGVVALIYGPSAEAGTFTPAEFKATASPSVLNLSVNPRGGINGNNQVTINVQRIRRNKVPTCNKIQFVEVLTGRDYRANQNVIGRYSFPGRGRCYFNTNLTVRPFSDAEIRNVCRNVRGGSRKLVKDGIVISWNRDVVELRNLWVRGGRGSVFDKPKNQADIRFVANVQCGRKAGPPPPPVASTPKQTCDLSGKWYENNRGSKFLRWKLTFNNMNKRTDIRWYRAEEFDAHGKVSPYVQGTFFQQGNYDLVLFSSRPNMGEYRVFRVYGYRFKDTCDRMEMIWTADTTSGFGKYNRGEVFLERAGQGQGRPKVTGFNPGRPTVPGHEHPQIKNKPTFKPGFKPGPPLPEPSPHW